MKCNPLKCAWVVKETSFLGHGMTPTVVKPMKKKINTILKVDTIKNQTQVRSFIGAVNFYCSLWPRRAHFMKHLLELTGKRTFKWTERQQKAFDTLKSIMTADYLNTYPDYNEPFEIYTDASDYQLGAAIIQKGRPVAYWSRSLTPTQSGYTTIEKELLAIILYLKEYEKILYGARIKVFTDHKNLTFKTLSIKRILCWQTYIDQYDVELCYIPGKENVLADCFSCLPRKESVQISEGGRSPSPHAVLSFDNSGHLKDNFGHLSDNFNRVYANEHRKRKRKKNENEKVTFEKRKKNENKKGTFVDFKKLKTPTDYKLDIDWESFFSIDDCNKTIECLLNLPSPTYMENPIEMQTIHNHQEYCQELLKLQQLNPH